MAKREVLRIIVVAAAILALAGSSVVWAKAHVPLGRAQICTPSGQVKNVGGRALSNRLQQGACRLTACVFNDVDNGDAVQQFIFFPGDPCDPTDANGDAFCDATGDPRSVPKRLSAKGLTPACTAIY